jgi:hypothetical protein
MAVDDTTVGSTPLWKGVEAAKVDGAVAMPTPDWLALQLFRREAEALILYDPIFPADPFAR